MALKGCQPSAVANDEVHRDVGGLAEARALDARHDVRVVVDAADDPLQAAEAALDAAAEARPQRPAALRPSPLAAIGSRWGLAEADRRVVPRLVQLLLRDKSSGEYGAQCCLDAS